MLRLNLSTAGFCDSVSSLRTIRVPWFSFRESSGLSYSKTSISPPALKYSSVLSCARSSSNSVLSPVSALIVSTRITRAIPNPANFPIPFRPRTGLCFAFVFSVGLFSRRFMPIFRYRDSHSSKVIPWPSSAISIEALTATLLGKVIFTTSESASHALAIGSASAAVGL